VAHTSKTYVPASHKLARAAASPLDAVRALVVACCCTPLRLSTRRGTSACGAEASGPRHGCRHASTACVGTRVCCQRRQVTLQHVADGGCSRHTQVLQGRWQVACASRRARLALLLVQRFHSGTHTRSIQASSLLHGRIGLCLRAHAHVHAQTYTHSHIHTHMHDPWVHQHNSRTLA